MPLNVRFGIVLGALVALAGCDGSSAGGGGDSGTPMGALTLSSGAFAAGGDIPREHSCEGADRSPPLAWSGAPAGTRSYALLVQDVDAFDFVHWVLFDVPGTATSLAAGLPTDAALSDGSRQGYNDFGVIGWGGPCPPSGEGPHTYVLTLYALDTTLGLNDASIHDVRAAMRGHVLAQGELRGRYTIP